jgi:ABC-2 type transport system permease protein
VSTTTTLADRLGAAPAGAPRRSSPGPATVRQVIRAERRKLLAQLSTRLIALTCLLGPLAFAGVLTLQGSVPADTPFGVWVHTSGFAVSLVVLGFVGAWGFPVMAGVLAGDLFAGEDRHGTWKTVLTRSASRRTVFVAKAVTVTTMMTGLVGITAVSSLVAGFVTAGAEPLVGLSGTQLSSSAALGMVAASWAANLLPALGFVGLAVLFSLVTRNGIAGAVGPVLVALVMQLLDLIGNGTWVHAALLGSAFSDWHGLFVSHPFVAPLLVGCAVSLAWITGSLALSWAVFRRRDFAGPPAGRRGWAGPLRLVLCSAAAIGLLAAGTSLGPTTITPTRLEDQLTPTFDNLLLLQQRLLGHDAAPSTRLRVLPQCSHRGGTSSGPGDDWTCTLNVFIPQSGVEPFQQTPVTYDMSVQADGCYKAEAPPSFIGQQLMRDDRGQEVVNPLFTIYGCFETDG